MAAGPPKRSLPLALALAALALGPAAAQEAPEEEGGSDQPRAGERLVLPVDDEAEAAFARVDDLAKRGQWDRVVKSLDALLDSGGGALLPSKAGEAVTLRTVRAEARRRLLALSGDGRAAWALVHDDAARSLLESAAGRADPAPLEALLARHPASALAGRARRLLLTRALERGDAGVALRQADGLLASGDLEPAERARTHLARALALALLGRAGEAEDALTASGAPEAEARRAQLAGLRRPPPVLPPDGSKLAWTRETFGFYEVDAGGSPSWVEPQADEARVYAHDGSHAQAVDLATGRLAWRTALRPEDAFLRPEGPCRLALGPTVVACARPGGDVVGLRRDDGAPAWRRTLQELRAAARIELPATVEALVPAGPLVVLLLVVEHDAVREVYAVAVDAAAGDVRWGLFLAGRTGGRRPAARAVAVDGALVVVTGLGVAVAIEADSGELRWARRYKSQRDPENRERRGGIRGLPNVAVDGEEIDAGPPERPGGLLAVRGVAWAAPPDGRGLFAWDARTGDVRAQHAEPATDRLLGAAELPDGPAVVVRTSDGDLALATRERLRPLCDLGGELAGDPCVLGGRAWLLRASAAGRGGELIEADLAAGALKRLGAAPAPRGHLTAQGGRLVLAGPRGLWALGAAPPPAAALAAGVDAASIAAVVTALGAPGFADREAALSRLVAIGEPSRAALTAASESALAELRLRALTALAELDRKDRLARWRPLVQPTWEEQVPDLLVRLTHPNPEVRLEALRAFGGLEDEAVTPLLRELLADPDRRLGFAAATALLIRGDRAGVQQLAEAVKSGLPSDQLAAVEVLTAHGSAADADAMRPGLRSEDGPVRAASAAGLLALGGEAALPEVEPLLQDPDEAVRLAIVERLIAVPPTPGVVAFLARAAEDGAAAVRMAAVGRLAKRDVGGPVALAAMARALGDELPEIARTAASRLLKLVLAPGADLSTFPVDALERASSPKRDKELRHWAAQIAMNYTGRGGYPTVEMLTRFMSDEEAEVRGWAYGGRSWGGFLLERVKEAALTPAEVAALGTAASSPIADVRVKALHVLSRAVVAPGAGRFLAGALDDEHPAIRKSCQEWLLGKDGAAPDLLDEAAIIEALRVAVTSTLPEGRTAADALLATAPRERLASALLAALRPGADLPPAVRAAAGARLAPITGVPFDPQADAAAAFGAQAVGAWRQAHPDRTLEVVLQELRDENPSTRFQAAQELAGLPVPFARNALGSSLDDPLEWVLKAKLEALVKVTGETFGSPRATSGPGLRERVQRARLWVAERAREDALRGSR